MKRIAAVVGLSLSLSLSGCAPSVVVKTTAVSGPTAAPAGALGFVVVRETEAFDGAAQELADINVKDAGLALNCDYDAVVELASARARQLGANVLRIYEHRPPSVMGSTCHRIRAKALRVADLTPYEKEIVWQTGRRLRQADFKASTDSRPFEAATYSGIRYRAAGRPIDGAAQVRIETYFDCHNSYFKGSSVTTLAHEQGHFDLSEIYARRLTKLLREQVTDTKDFELRHETLYRQLMTEWQTRQDQYDSEIYADRSKQAGWLTRIEQELQTLQPYADKQVRLKFKL